MRITVALLLATLLPPSLAHTFLTFPDAYNRVFQLRNCHGKQCHQACPDELPEEDMRNTAENAVVLRRGQLVHVKWARNNHLHGMVRLALVPYKRRMNRRWHARLGLWYGCFVQGKYRCRGEMCGSDNHGYGYSAKIRVPSTVPNGLYVLGLVWWGGIHWPLSKGTFFSDYWSCAYVKVKGGGKVRGRFRARFDPGDEPSARVAGGKCFTAVDAPGVCPRNGCRGPAGYGLPRAFKNGRSPRVVTTRDYMEAMK